MEERVLRAIEQAGLSDYRELIERNLAPCIHVRTASVDDPTAIPIGSSRLGGDPDIPTDFVWPMWKGKAQHFLAQINLSDCEGMPGMDVLPEFGHLLFFYDRDQNTWGYDPKDKGSFHVCYIDDATSELARTIYPQEVVRPSWWKRLWSLADTFSTGFTPCRLEFEPVLTLSNDWAEELDSDSVDLEDFQFSILPLAMGIQVREANNQILGHAAPIQGDMRLECEMVAKGYYCGDGRAYKQIDVKEYEARSKDWILLFQLDSDKHAGMMWGDAGMLYFMIRKQDLATRHFDRVWMVLQCC